MIDLEYISQSSRKINNLLRHIDSQRRPIILSALMICLYDKNSDFFKNFNVYENKKLLCAIPEIVGDILQQHNIAKEKIEMLLGELSFLQIDKTFQQSDILKNILQTLEAKVLPLFNQISNRGAGYDIIGKFYEEFLQYAGVANVKKGIVLTPSHIAKLFTKLIDIKSDDIIFDPACGTGAFLIAGLEKLIKLNGKKQTSIIKSRQILGIEKSSTMFALSIVNMLYSGEGMFSVFNEDFFSKKANIILEKQKPTIGFINPPFGGKDNKSNPTKKEIQFLERLLDVCSRYVIIISPLSTFFKYDFVRLRILKKHRLKYVLNMPSDLFQPNAMTHTAIAVFQTHVPHNNEKVIFYDLKSDGFVLSKNKGRIDAKHKWHSIEKSLLEKIKNPNKYNDNINLVFKEIKADDEWIIQAHCKTDYNNLTKEDFLQNIREYVIFQIKKDLGLLGKEIDTLALLEILAKHKIKADSILGKKNE